MKYDKLVRDKIPEVLKKNGCKSKFHVADRDEYLEKLFEKFGEEINELLKAKNEEEMADVLDVMDALSDTLIKYFKLNRRKIRKIQINKARERGRFKKMIILEEAEA